MGRGQVGDVVTERFEERYRFVGRGIRGIGRVLRVCDARHAAQVVKVRTQVDGSYSLSRRKMNEDGGLGSKSRCYNRRKGTGKQNDEILKTSLFCRTFR